MSLRDDLKSVIREKVIVRSESGARIISLSSASSSWLYDFRAVILSPQWLDAYAELFWQKFADQYPFQVGGLETAGIPLVAAIVMKGVQRGTPVNGFYIRKSRKRDGLLKFIEGTLDEHPIILVDDIINSGRTLNRQIEVLRAAGKRIAHLFAAIAFRAPAAYEFATTQGIGVSNLFTLTDFDMPLEPSNAPEVPADAYEILWHFASGDPSFEHVIPKSAPVIDEERIYMGSDRGTIWALDRKDGSVAWRFDIEKNANDTKGIFSTPALYRGAIYFGAYDGNVYALNAKDGRKKWAFSDADWVGSSPALAPDKGLLFIGLEFGLFGKRGGLVALSMETGKKIWSVRTAEFTHCSPLYIKEESIVVIGSNDCIFYAYDAVSGELRWQYQTRGEIKSRAAYDPARRLVLFGSYDGNVYALSASDGHLAFLFHTRASIYSTPLVQRDAVLIASLDKNLYAVDLDTGVLKWSFATSGRIFASPVFADSSFWIGSNDGCLYEIDPMNGKLQSFLQLSERIVNAIAYDERDKFVYVSTVANEIYCVRKQAS
jgi:outer membrane protein assembly factor BamB/adenine/guanine phosphoribosyltransferase-like PRPP-binding protein